MFKNHPIASTGLALLGILLAAGCQSTRTETMSRQEQPPARIDTAEAEKQPEKPAPLVGLETVYFDLDRAELDADARQALKSNAQRLQVEPDTGVVVIEGHCDERGSEEYNLALGQRRAAAVKQYLEDLGVPGARLRTVSYGESRPAVRGEDESAWRLNRRSEIRSGLHQASR